MEVIHAYCKESASFNDCKQLDKVEVAREDRRDKMIEIETILDIPAQH